MGAAYDLWEGTGTTVTDGSNWTRRERVTTLRAALDTKETFDGLSSIAKDENEDGYFTLEELSKWLETNKLVKLVEEGRHAEVDKLIAAQAFKVKESKEQISEGK